MLSMMDCAKCLRRQRIKLVLLLMMLCVGLIVYAKSAGGARGPFALARDLPRGPIVYAQFRDLPALLKRWDESALKQRYLSSTSFQQLRNRHLALKLAERWEELNAALGFTFDTETLAGAAGNEAAIAVYDIGRLDLVFVTTLDEERLAASKFFESREQFEETELPDGTTYYRRDMESDRGREKQQLVFASLRGRFVLATSERLLLRTLANINGKTQKDRLADDPAFKSLSEKSAPHSATVWVDQAKLNDDWYFNRYWLMRNAEQLKGIRACMFDLELRDAKWIEHRDLLYAVGRTAPASRMITAPEAKRISGMLPAGLPYFKLSALDGDAQSASTLIRDTLLDRAEPHDAGQDQKNWDWRFYGDSDFRVGQEDQEWSDDSRYSYLGQDYDSIINDPDDAGISEREEPGDNPLKAETEGQLVSALQRTLERAHPLRAAAATDAQTMKGPLFVEFRRAAILTLRSPSDFDRQAFESAIGRAVEGRLMTAGSYATLAWANANQQDQLWRELQLPMLGWELCYTLRGQDLIVANSRDFLRAILAGGAGKQLAAEAPEPFDELTVINLDQKKQVFDDVMDRLDAQRVKARSQSRAQEAGEGSAGASQEFFSGNISSLLGVASDISRVEVRRSSLPDRLHEEIDFILK